MNSPQNFFLTGCASGIGQHMANVLLASGHKVWATDVNLAALTRHAELQGWPAERVRVRQLDVRDAQAWDAAVSEAAHEFGRIDVLMNIAGYLWADNFYEMPAEEVDRNIDINTKGVIFGTQSAARQMLKQKQGHIINIGSMAGLAPITSLAIYSASKYAVRGFSLAAAQELRPHGIYVTVVCPDAVETPMTARQRGRIEAAILFSSPKLLTVEEVGKAIIERVLPNKPLEAYLPLHRGWLARFADVFPMFTFQLGPLFTRRGRAHQLQSVEERR